TLVSQRGLGEYQLPVYPVQSGASPVVSFKLDVLSSRTSSGGEVWDTTSFTEYDQFIVDYDNGILRLLGALFVPGTRNYRITCTAGYLTGSAQPYVPSSLEELCLQWCKLVYKDSKNLSSESIGTWRR